MKSILFVRVFVRVRVNSKRAPHIIAYLLRQQQQWGLFDETLSKYGCCLRIQYVRVMK